MQNKKLLFVYGSLRKDLGNHHFLDNENASYLGNYVTPPEWTMYSLGAFPALADEGHTPIMGEVYSVSEAVYASIERLEGYPSFYQRKPLTTPYGEAEVYYIPDIGRYGQHPVVEHGDWREFLFGE